MNIAKKTIFYIIIVGIILVVLIPLSYLITTSFSSTLETLDYPKPLIPKISHELKVSWNEDENYYEIKRKSPKGVYEDLYNGSNFDRISKYLEDYLNIKKSPSQLENDFVKAKSQEEPIKLKYYKN